MALAPEQQRIVRKIKRRGNRVGATRKEKVAAVETGLVESNLRNLPGGDADSAGWRQERASLYKNPTNLNQSIDRFFKETRAVRGRYSNAGDLAAAVQRPAAQYRSRYGQRADEAKRLLGGVGAGDDDDDGGGTGARTRVTTTRTPGVSNRAARGQLIASFLTDKDSDVLDFASQLSALKDIAGTSTTTRQRIPGQAGADGGGGAGGGGLTARATRRARIINRQGLPYSWGGGHAGQTPIRKAVALDCSGAVSKVLGINPRVASQFSTWGKPGDGGNRGVTVYSNPTHTLMKINGRFFGTSGSNPGGGAGWIPSSAVSSDYLKGFTARHRNA